MAVLFFAGDFNSLYLSTVYAKFFKKNEIHTDLIWNPKIAFECQYQELGPSFGTFRNIYTIPQIQTANIVQFLPYNRHFKEIFQMYSHRIAWKKYCIEFDCYNVLFVPKGTGRKLADLIKNVKESEGESVIVLLEEGLGFYEFSHINSSKIDRILKKLQPKSIDPRPKIDRQGTNPMIDFILCTNKNLLLSSRPDLISNINEDKILNMSLKNIFCSDNQKYFLQQLNLNCNNFATDCSALYLSSAIHKKQILNEVKFLNQITNNKPTDKFSILLKPHPRADLEYYYKHIVDNAILQMIPRKLKSLPAEIIYGFFDTSIVITPRSTAGVYINYIYPNSNVIYVDKIVKIYKKDLNQSIIRDEHKNIYVPKSKSELNKILMQIYKSDGCTYNYCSDCIQTNDVGFDELNRILSKSKALNQK